MASLTAIAQGTHELAARESGQGTALAAAVPAEVERGALAGAALPPLPAGWAVCGERRDPRATALPRRPISAAAVVIACLVGVPLGVAVAVGAVAEVVARWVA